MAKLTDILSDITQNEMSKKLMRMTEAEINTIPSHALTESLSRLEEFAGRSAPRSRIDKDEEELASINQARANAGLPLIKPKAPAPAPAPADPAIVQRKSASDIETQAALAAAKAEMDAQRTKPKVAAQMGTKPLPSQDAIANSWSDDAGVDIAPDLRGLSSRKARISADDEEDITGPAGKGKFGLDEREASDSNLQKLATLRKLIQRIAEKKAAEKFAKTPVVKEGGQNYKDKRYDDDDKVPSNNEPMKIPKKLGRKGDGLGCRDHVNCRHNHKADDGEHPRTVAKRKAVRKAVQQHPRNMEEGGNAANEAVRWNRMGRTYADMETGKPLRTKKDSVQSKKDWMAKREKEKQDAILARRSEMEEGKLSRIAAGLGLAGAAMAGGAKDAGAQQATQAPTTQVPNDSVQTVTGRDPGIAARRANMNLTGHKIDSQGARIRQTPNPDGTWTVTVDARKQPATAPRTNEGGNAVNKEKKNDAVAKIGHKLQPHTNPNHKDTNLSVGRRGTYSGSDSRVQNTGDDLGKKNRWGGNDPVSRLFAKAYKNKGTK